jgi:hypothetical protein
MERKREYTKSGKGESNGRFASNKNDPSGYLLLIEKCLFYLSMLIRDLREACWELHRPQSMNICKGKGKVVPVLN